MKRRTLDLMFSLGGVVIAILLTVAGVVLTANANFATDYVTSQLAEQNITFKTLDTLTPDEREQPDWSSTPGRNSPRASRPRCTPCSSSACT
ncbi:hypothetical protein ACFQZ4_02540 [Catellatospora coxensis]